MHFSQLLMGQGRSKILIVFVDQVDSFLHGSRIQPVVTRSAASFAYQTRRSLLFICPEQAFYLPYADPQHSPCFELFETLVS